jgi:predicted enzyme related to lactoylglutathione lyase
MHESLSNTIDYIEMPSRNLAETKRFSSALFGWPFVNYGSDFSSFDDGRMVGGFFTSKNPY